MNQLSFACTYYTYMHAHKIDNIVQRPLETGLIMHSVSWELMLDT